MSARFIVGDTRAVTATLPDGSVELFMSSPPYLALRSYLPADHPSKHLEIGSEATPAEFIDVLLELTAEWRRVLNPRTGSIVIELGDTYAGSGEPGWERTIKPDHRSVGRMRGGTGDGRARDLTSGWPRNKSATLIPESYRWALAYGRNPFTGAESPAGRWQVRNVITRCSPNPPVGALGKKWRPATTDLVVATPDDDRRYWDDVATRVSYGERSLKNTGYPTSYKADAVNGYDETERTVAAHPAGAPLLDWWQIVAGGYPGAHYAVYPPELCEPFIEAMCPRRVCLQCGEPSRRETEPSDRYLSTVNGGAGEEWRHGRSGDATDGYVKKDGGITAEHTTIGWSTCGHPGTDGLRLDGYHTGTGWRPGIVLDPFAGTGTTLAVATGHGRDAIGIDLDPRNADLALDRVGPLLLTVEHHDTTTVA